MQAFRLCPPPSSSQTRVVEPEPQTSNKKRQRMPVLVEVVQTPGAEVKKIKSHVEVVAFMPAQPQEAEEEMHTESPKNTRKREREPAPAAEEELNALINKMEKVSIQTQEVFNVVGEMGGAFTIYQRSLAIELDPDASLDMSDDEFVRITTRCPNFTHLTVFQSRSISDAGIIRALMGRSSMYAVNLAACPKITDWTLKALGAQCPNLAKLSLAKCSITDDGMGVLASKCKMLRAVNLDWCHPLTDKTLEALALHCPNLREFTAVEGFGYTLNGLKALLRGCPKLEKLELWGCAQVDDRWIQALIDSGCPLKEVDFGGCPNVSEDALDKLSAAFERITILSDKAVQEDNT